MTPRKLWIAGAAFGCAFVIWGGAALYRAGHARHRAAAEVSAAGSLGFTARVLDRALPAVEPVSAPAVYRDAAVFQGSIYVSTPSALVEYDSGGAVRHRWRCGLELPAAQLGPLAVGAQQLWIATEGAGLIAWDGRRLQQILPDAPGARKITAILPEENGRMVLGTAAAGVLVYDGRRLAPFDHALAGIHVSVLEGDPASLWVGTIDRGVYHWHAGMLDHFSEPQGLPDPQVTSILATPGRAFVGTPMGIAEFRDGTAPRRLAVGFFTSALELDGERLLAGSLDEGIAAIPTAPRLPRLERLQSQSPDGEVRRIFRRDGVVLALTSTGLYAADGQTLAWKRVLGAESGTLADRNVSALAVDRAGRLWIGYFDRGLDVMEGERVTHFENDSLFCVNRIVHNPADGATAVATANGLVLFDARPVQRQVLRRAQGLISDHVTDVVMRGGAMTLATPAGITVIDAGGTHSVSDFHGLVNQHVYALAAVDDELLAGTLGGLSVFERGVVKASFTTFNSRLKHNWITGIRRVGDDWFVGTYGAGVLRLKRNGDWDAFPDLRGALVINPNAMLVTPTRVYAGTMENGLAIYDRATERWRQTSDGLPSLNVTALAAAGGTIYIGTDNGLVRAAEQDLR